MADRKRLRVLVVEDEALIAMMIEDYLLDMGHEVVGPVSRLEPAVGMAATERFDCALLDVNLSGRRSFPVAEALEARRIPFLFATAYGEEALSPEFAARPLLRKPFSAAALQEALEALVRA